MGAAEYVDAEVITVMGVRRYLRQKFGYFTKGPTVTHRKPSTLGGNIVILETYNPKFGTTYWVAREGPGHGWDGNLFEVEGYKVLRTLWMTTK